MIPSSGSPPIIAVVAVHGVADQKPNESARAISSLLLGLQHEFDTRFASFREFAIGLPNRRVDIEETSRGEGIAARMDVRAQFLRESAGGSVSEADYRFMRELLGSYQQAGEDGVYQTVRLEGRRLPDNEAAGGERGRASVHIYEAYWADLSRVSDRLYRIVGEFYQLILHLPFLGLQALDMRRAAPDNTDKKWWARHRTDYRACLSILTLPIPVLNVLLLALGLSVLPGKLPARWHALVALGVVAALSAIGSAWYLFGIGAVRSPWAWIGGALVIVAATLVTAQMIGCFSSIECLSLSQGCDPGLFLQLGFGWWLASGGLIYLLFRGYDHHNPGALRVAVASYIVVTPGFLAALWNQPNTKAGLDEAMLRTLEPAFVLLSATWLALALLATWHLGRGWCAKAMRPGFKLGLPDASALFTSRLTLSLSIGIFSQVTFLIWAADPEFEPDLDRLLSDAPREGALPVYFLTMGCPLRQLYRLRFPDLYRWVGPADGESDVGPKAQALGVARWVNLYRSGDYVGRSLWTRDSDLNLFVPRDMPYPIGGIEAETCIGAGAHTHYWDDTAPMVALELDRLIVQAITDAAPPTLSS